MPRLASTIIAIAIPAIAAISVQGARRRLAYGGRDYDWPVHWEGKSFADAFEQSPARPMHSDGRDITSTDDCPAPLKAACASKGVKAAHLEGPIACGGQGAWCRIMPKDNFPTPCGDFGSACGEFSDPNFFYCNGTTGNLLPEGEIGHAHGFRRDATYTAESGLGSGWLQDHWFRAYSGTLHCCCNPFSATGVVNRMDAGTDGRPEQEIDLGWCEGEEKQDPLYSGGEECWSVEFFGDYMALPLTAAEMPPPYPNILPGEGSPSPSPSPSPGSKTYVISGGSFISPYYDFSPALEPLEPGMTYTFEAAGIAANHPFVIAVAWGIVPEPLPTPFLQEGAFPLVGSSGTVTFTVPPSYNGSLRYYCDRDGDMSALLPLAGVGPPALTCPSEVCDFICQPSACMLPSCSQLCSRCCVPVPTKPPPAPPPPASSLPPPSPATASGCNSDGWCQSPEGPSQQCADDAGPPWADDLDNFGANVRYHDNTPAEPILPADGACPGALAGACAVKGIKAAYLDGPIDCGGQGWFCRIMPQPGWGDCSYGDCNFANCATPNADELDTDGHCHGSDDDSTYGWWVRDHHFRGYTGTLNCCCGSATHFTAPPPQPSRVSKLRPPCRWGEPMHGVVNRCDYRKPVSGDEVATCRDANEEHDVDFNPTCDAHPLKPDPVTNGGMCWTVRSFAAK
uniref:Uncharacterized protein n=1 Tax=Emiliania huxleyi TaxID=2903 RepID=A0A7S3TP04_EMIHU